MRKALIGVVLIAALVVGVVLFAGTSLLSSAPLALADQTCQAAVAPSTPAAGDGPGQAAALDDEQRGIVGQIIEIGTKRDLSPRAWQVAIQAGMTESRLRNLSHGDRDSLGIFQMRPSMGWGTPAELADIDYQINKFYDVLDAVPGWATMRPGDAAQKVERSGFPQRYHEWEAMAVELIGSAGEVTDPGGCGESAGAAAPGSSEAAQMAIDAAMRWLGTTYAWGGGTADGPSTGIRDGGVADAHGDYNKVGFDCSGLMVYAYAQAGITLPRQSTQQYAAGEHVPVEEAQPGDLVFWGDSSGSPATIHHVAMVIDTGKIVEAPQSGDVVKVSDIAARDSGLVAQATRPGV